MSVLQDLRTRARHRGLTRTELLAKAGRLEREANSTMCTLISLATEVDALKAERTELQIQLDEAAIDLSGALFDKDTVKAQLTLLANEVADLRAFKAAATVPPELPVADGEITQPIKVTTLHEALAGHSPAHIPTWAATTP